MEPNAAKRDLHGLWRCTSLKTMEKLHGGKVISKEEVNGVMRVKIVVSKQELRQMVASMSQRRGNAAHHDIAAPPPSVEKLLHVLRRKHMQRAEARRVYRGGWRPALQSIPEET